MKLTMEVPSGAHLVRGYGAGEVRVGESRMTSACGAVCPFASKGNRLSQTA